MQEVNLLLSEDKRFNFIGVRFSHNAHAHCEGHYNSKIYHYKTIEEFELGDFAVVDVSGELKVVKVVEVDCVCQIGSTKYKWTVQKVDTTQYTNCLAVEEKLTVAINKLRIAQLRREVEDNLLEELGKTGLAKVKKLIRL